MTGDAFQKTYQLVDEKLALFNEEHYISVWRVSIKELNEQAREALFDALFGFEHADLEVQVDVSEESQDTWYLQLLIPYLFTPLEQAQKRLIRGGIALSNYLKECGFELEASSLRETEIYNYLKRYNPEIA
ncbi:hypothetical protein ACQCN2_20450 [Brevibacillus ginsengisoli]|uniref:hypothetical protein n=1 Tax=Brevibacillus ginsengisoli TaxID=363854 RepID=UPI003CF3A21B